MLPDTKEKLQEGGICRDKFEQKGDDTEYSPTNAKEKLYNCGICKKSFTRRSYGVHLLTHVAGKLHQCGECKMKFVQKSLLVQHLNTHAEKGVQEQNVSDEDCPEDFDSKQDFIHDKEKPQNTTLNVVKSTETDQVVKCLPSYTRKVHKCEICGRLFPRPGRLLKHIATHTKQEIKTDSVEGKQDVEHSVNHTSKKRHQCGVCGKRFSRPSLVKRHLRVHAREKAQSSETLGAAERPQTAVHPSLRCGKCGKTFSHPYFAKRHMIMHMGGQSHRVEKKSHVCGICGKKFNRPSRVKRHMAVHRRGKTGNSAVCGTSTENSQVTKHPPSSTNKSHMCGICGKKFSRPYRVRRHMVIHTKGRIASIGTHNTEGNQVIRQPFSFLNHMEKKSHACKVCGKRFLQPYLVKRHMIVHMKVKSQKFGINEMNSTENNQTVIAGMVKSSRECAVCGKKFRRPYLVREHMVTHSKEEVQNASIPSTLPYREGQVVKQPVSRVEKKAHQCKICGKRFRRPYLLREHMVRHENSGIRSMESEGENKFAREPQTYMTKNSHECKICGKKFLHPYLVRRHMTVHMKEKTLNPTVRDTTEEDEDASYVEQSHECRMCGKKFLCKSSVTRHMLTHTGVTYYECDRCTKKFVLESDLEKHRHTHSSGSKTYRCRICSKKFSRRSHVTRHLVTHSKNKQGKVRNVYAEAEIPDSLLFAQGQTSTDVVRIIKPSQLKVVLEDIFAGVQEKIL